LCAPGVVLRVGTAWIRDGLDRRDLISWFLTKNWQKSKIGVRHASKN